PPWGARLAGSRTTWQVTSFVVTSSLAGRSAAADLDRKRVHPGHSSTAPTWIRRLGGAQPWPFQGNGGLGHGRATPPPAGGSRRTGCMAAEGKRKRSPVPW